MRFQERRLVEQSQISLYVVQRRLEQTIERHVARSRAEFAAKLGTVLEEADESLYWLELIREGKLIAESKLSLLLTEAGELTAILAAGRKSAAANTSNIKHRTSYMGS